MKLLKFKQGEEYVHINKKMIEGVYKQSETETCIVTSCCTSPDREWCVDEPIDEVISKILYE